MADGPSIKTIIIPIVALLVIATVLPSMIETVGNIKTDGCADTTDPSKPASDKGPECVLGEVQIEPSYGLVVRDGIGLLTPGAILCAGIFGVIGFIRYAMNRAAEE